MQCGGDGQGWLFWRRMMARLILRYVDKHSWKKPPPLFHRMYYRRSVWVDKKIQRKTDRGWRDRWLAWNVNVCSIKLLMDRAVLSSVCVWRRESHVVCHCVCTRTSLRVYLHQQVHEYACACSHEERRALSVETDHPMMGNHWKIGLILHTFTRLWKCHL